MAEENNTQTTTIVNPYEKDDKDFANGFFQKPVGHALANGVNGIFTVVTAPFMILTHMLLKLALYIVYPNRKEREEIQKEIRKTQNMKHAQKSMESATTSNRKMQILSNDKTNNRQKLEKLAALSHRTGQTFEVALNNGSFLKFEKNDRVCQIRYSDLGKNIGNDLTKTYTFSAPIDAVHYSGMGTLGNGVVLSTNLAEILKMIDDAGGFDASKDGLDQMAHQRNISVFTKDGYLQNDLIDGHGAKNAEELEEVKNIASEQGIQLDEGSDGQQYEDVADKSNYEPMLPTGDDLSQENTSEISLNDIPETLNFESTADLAPITYINNNEKMLEMQLDSLSSKFENPIDMVQNAYHTYDKENNQMSNIYTLQDENNKFHIITESYMVNGISTSNHISSNEIICNSLEEAQQKIEAIHGDNISECKMSSWDDFVKFTNNANDRDFLETVVPKKDLIKAEPEISSANTVKQKENRNNVPKKSKAKTKTDDFTH